MLCVHKNAEQSIPVSPVQIDCRWLARRWASHHLDDNRRAQKWSQKTLWKNKTLCLLTNFEEEWSNDLVRAVQLKNLGFLPSSQITGIKLKLPSVAMSWMRAMCGVGNLEDSCLHVDNAKWQMPRAVHVASWRMDHLLQCPMCNQQQIRLRNQLSAIMNRNDETKLLTKAEKESRRVSTTVQLDGTPFGQN